MAAVSRVTPHPDPTSAAPGEGRPTTLLALVQAVSEETLDDREVVATVLEMLRRGDVRLCGNFRNVPIDELC